MVEMDTEAVKLFNEEGSITNYGGFIRLRLATPYRAQMYGFIDAIGGGKIVEQKQRETTLYVWSMNGKSAIKLLNRMLPALTGHREEQAIEILALAHERGWV